MLRSITPVSLILATAVSSFVSAEDHDKKIKRSQLPDAVQKTVAKQSKGAEVTGFTMEREAGKTYYEAERRVNGHSKDVLMDANGKVVEVEEDVASRRHFSGGEASSTKKEGLDTNTDPGLTERREKCCCLTSALIG